MDNEMERTLVLLKPDAVQRRLVGRILWRLEDKGLKIVGLRMLMVSKETARQMYGQHEGKDFYEPLLEFITACPVVAVVLEGLNVVAVARKLMGETFGPDAAAGTIRGDFGASRRYNLVHGSDSPQSAKREIAILFRPEELVDYELIISSWVYAKHFGKLI
jgi:nucleoside-diphosphate kinase